MTARFGFSPLTRKTESLYDKVVSTHYVDDSLDCVGNEYISVLLSIFIFLPTFRILGVFILYFSVSSVSKRFSAHCDTNSHIPFAILSLYPL